MPTSVNLNRSIEPPKVGGHPALDLLNTVFLLDGVIVDSLQTDQDALQWLADAGWQIEHDLTRSKPGALLRSARSLRESIRKIIETRKAGKRADPTPLNAFLAQSQSHLRLSPAQKGTFHLERHWNQHTPEEILAPIAEAAAELLATGDFNLVRHCEDSECVLWFYDRTRSHHRRWCSMATCGNRNKVAAFRHRNQSTT